MIAGFALPRSRGARRRARRARRLTMGPLVLLAAAS